MTLSIKLGSSRSGTRCRLGKKNPSEEGFFFVGLRVGGGFWLGQAYEDWFGFVIEEPVSLRQGIEYWFSIRRAMEGGDVFYDSLDDFKLVSG